MQDQGNSDHDKHGVRVPVDSARNEHLCELSAWFDSTCINTSSLVDAFPPVVVFFFWSSSLSGDGNKQCNQGRKQNYICLTFFFDGHFYRKRILTQHLLALGFTFGILS